MIRTFLDSGVLIAAVRSISSDRERVLTLLEDPNRVFLTSPFVQLEVVPRAIFYRKETESAFYRDYFTNATWYRDAARIEKTALLEATRSGLAAMDALHVAAAWLANADALITTEKPTMPMHRSSLVKVVYLFA